MLRPESSAFSSENLPNWRAGELVNVPGSRVQASRVVRRRHSTSGSVSGMDGACGAGPTRRAEPVKEFETVVGQSLCMSASREGSLIHATVGILGGVGRRPWNRWGFAL